MDSSTLEELYWQTLEAAAQTAKLKDVKNSNSSFDFLDTEAWIWSVRLYALLLRDCCVNISYKNEYELRRYLRASRISSANVQAMRILSLFGISDEAGEGAWLKEFRSDLDRLSGKGSYTDKRSFVPRERVNVLASVQELGKKANFTSIILTIVLLETAHMSDTDSRVNKILEILPAKAEEYYMPLEKTILKNK